MEQSRWDRTVQLFGMATELDQCERDEFLRRECQDDEVMLGDIRELLACHESNNDQRFDSFSKQSVTSLLKSDAVGGEADWSGRQLGIYSLEKLIGRGGFSNVYLARRTTEFEQLVAIKILRVEFGLSESVQQRFELERQVLADLNHINIAKVFDGGYAQVGCPYLVMEYIAGGPLMEHCKRKQLSLRRRVELFKQVCEAIGLAHSLGIIHRDIKPSNLLVSDHGIPKVVDFGIAKLTNKDAGVPANLTQSGLLPMTPSYASPEQIRGETVGLASDVYSLGVVLYELLAGQRPYSVDDCTPAQVESVVAEQQVPRPSLAARTASHRKELRRLDGVVMKALRKDATRRYRTASDMAEDLGRYLDGEPVLAGSEDVSYRVREFVRRHRLPIFAAALVFLSLTTALITSSRALREQRKTAIQLQEQAYIADAQVGFAAIENRRTQLAREIFERNDLPANRQFVGIEHYALELLSRSPKPLVLAQHDGPAYEIALFRNKPWVASVGGDNRILVTNFRNGEVIATLVGEGPYASVAVSPDERFLASGQGNSQDQGGPSLVGLWDLTTFEFVGNIASCDASLESISFSPDGERLALGARYDDLQVISVPDGELQSTFSVGDRNPRYRSLRFLDDGRLLTPAKMNERGHLSVSVQLFHRDLSVLDRTYESNDSYLKCFATDQSLLVASGDYHPLLHVFDLESGRQLWVQDVPFGPKSVALSPDGKRVAAGMRDGGVREWLVLNSESNVVDSSTSEPQLRLADATTIAAHHGAIHSISYTDEGRLITAGGDGLVKIWPSSMRSKLKVSSLQGTDKAHTVHSGNARRSVLRCWPISVYLKDGVAAGPASWKRWPTNFDFKSVALANDGERLAFGLKDDHGLVRLKMVESPYETIANLTFGDAEVLSIDFSPDDSLLVATGETAQTKVWDLASGECLHTFQHIGKGNSVRVSSDGRLVAVGTDEVLEIFDLTTGSAVYSKSVASPIKSVLWQDNRPVLATGHEQGDVMLHDLSGQSPTSVRLIWHEDPVVDLAFVGDRLVSCCYDGSIRFWHTRTKRSLGRIDLNAMLDEETATYGVGFAPSGDGKELDVVTFNSEHSTRFFTLPLDFSNQSETIEQVVSDRGTREARP